jgi:hypothetical protein
LIFLLNISYFLVINYIFGFKNIFVSVPLSLLFFYIDLQLTPKLFLSWLKLRSLNESKNKKILNQLILPLLVREKQRKYHFFFSVKLSREFFILDLPFGKKIIICGVDILNDLEEDETKLLTMLIINAVKSKKYRKKTLLFLVLIKLFLPLIVLEFVFKDLAKGILGQFLRWLGTPLAHYARKVNLKNYVEFLDIEDVNPSLLRSLAPLKYKLEATDNSFNEEGIVEYLAIVLSPVLKREESYLFILGPNK